MNVFNLADIFLFLVYYFLFKGILKNIISKEKYDYYTSYYPELKEDETPENNKIFIMYHGTTP